MSECKCSFRIKMVGDGCEVCNPEFHAQLLADQAYDQMMDDFYDYWNAPEQEELRKSCACGWARKIWMQSRASICIEMPVRLDRDGSRHNNGVLLDYYITVEAITKTGVRVK